MFESYKYRIEAHCHTYPVSGCSNLTPAEMMVTQKNAGMDAIILTNHFYAYHVKDHKTVARAVEDYMNDYYHCKRLGEQMGIKVLLGMEPHFTNHEDCLLYGVDEGVVRDMCHYIFGTLEDFRNYYRHDHMFFGQAHPYRNEHIIPAEWLDGYEAFNANTDRNEKFGFTTKLCAKNHLIPTGGCDCHRINQAGKICILTKTLPNDSFEFADILFSRDYIFEMAGLKIVPPEYSGDFN